MGIKISDNIFLASYRTQTSNIDQVLGVNTCPIYSHLNYCLKLFRRFDTKNAHLMGNLDFWEHHF